MPATSQQQQKLFGLALSVKRGETPRSEVSDEVLNIVDTMSEKKIKDFAETSHKGLPTKVETAVRNLVRETFREKVLGENKFIKPKDEAGVRTVKAIHNNINSIYELVIGKKKNPNEVLSAFSNPLINSIKQAIKHNYKPNSNTQLNKKVSGDVSNEERIKIFKGELNKILQLAEKVTQKPTVVGVKQLFMGWRDVWNYKNGAKIGLSGELHNSIIETIREKVLGETVNTKNIGVDTVLNFKDGEVWRVTKVIGNTSNPRGFFVKPHDAKTKKANTSIEIELKPDFLQKNLKSINEATDIKIGDKIKIYDTQSGEILAKITSIINKNRIEVKYKNLTLYAEKEKSGRWSIDESINEATPIQKIFRKIGWGGDGWTPQDYARQIKDLSDDTLKIWYDSAKSNKGIPNTPLAFQQKLTKIEMEKRGLLETVNEEQEQLDEKLITFSNRAPYGQVVFIAGGAGSGKGFAVENFLDSASFKVRDVDEMKKQLQKLNAIGKLSIQQIVDRFGKNIKPADLEGIKKIQSDGFDLKTMDLKNPNHVYALHILVKAMDIKDKSLVNMLGAAKNPEALPNIMFDITAKEIADITEVLPQLLAAGYKSNNIHLVWVLSNYQVAIKANQERDRVVPADILLKTHIGAGNTIWGLVTKALPKDMNGRVDVVLNNRENTIPYTEKDEKTLIKVQARGKKQPEIVVKSFLSLPVKKQGGSILPEKLWKDILYKWIKDNAPAELTANM